MAFYCILPEYFAIELSETLPLITASRIVLLILMVYCCISSNQKNKLSLKLKHIRLFWPILIYFVLRIVVNLYHVFFTPSAIKELFVILFEQLFLLITVVAVINSKKVLLRAIQILIYACGIVSVFAIQETFTGINIAYYLNTVNREMLQVSYLRLGILRAEFSFGHPVYFAAFCVLMIPLIMYFYENTKFKRYLIIMVLDFIALFLSCSRGSLFIAIFILILMICNKRWSQLKLYLKWIPVFVVVIMIIILCFSNFTELIHSIFNSLVQVFNNNMLVSNYGENAEGLSSRVIQLTGIQWVLQNHPIFGFGANANGRGLVRYLADGVWKDSSTYDIGYVEFIMEEGIVGFVAQVLLLIALVIQSFKKSDKSNSANFNNALFYCFLAYTLSLTSAVGLESVYWILIALFVSFNNLNEDISEYL